MRNIKKIFFIITLVFSFLFLGQTNVYASTFNISKISTNSEGTLNSDTSYSSYKAKLTNSSGTVSNQNISYVKSSLEYSKVVVSSVVNKNGIVASDVIEIAKNYEKNNPGYEVIAAVNGAYFGYATPYFPINACVTEGSTIKASNHTKYFSLGFKSDGSSFVTSKINSVSPNYYLMVYDANTNALVKEVQINGENVTPTENQTTFFDGSVIKQTTSTIKYFEIDATSNFRYDQKYLAGKIIGSTTTMSSKPIVATMNQDLIELLNNNPRVVICKKLQGDLEGYENVIGPGSQPLLNGNVQSVSAMGDQNESFCTSRAPRTAIGFDENNNVILCTVDGRQTNIQGISLIEEAEIMRELGCNNAFNLDGGGSTQLVVKKNGSFVMVNSPSETPYRKVTDAVLIVAPKVKVSFSNVATTESSISFDYNVVENNVNAEIKIFVNGKEVAANNHVVLSNLIKDNSNFINVVASYTNTSSEEVCIPIKTFQVNKTKDVGKISLAEPTNFNLTFEKTSAGFKVILTCDDPTSSLSKVYVVDNNGNQTILLKDINGYSTEFNASSNANYTFSILYYYKVSSIKVESKTYDQTFNYEHIVNVVTPSPSTPPANAEKNCNNSAFIVFSSLLASAFVVLIRSRKNR
jgi:exopolysaccharide biosynthesis protein